MKQAVPVRDKENPAGRLDVLLLRLGERLTQIYLEAPLSGIVGQPVQLWGGEGGIRSVVERKIKEAGLPNKQLSAEAIAEMAGFLRKPKRIKKGAA